jgi:hypothetical protein
MDQLDKQVGVRAQLIDKISLKKQKQKKLRAAADRLVTHEKEVREHIQDEIVQRLAQESEDAKRTGLIESVDDPILREMAKKDAIKRNDQEELDEDVNEIEGMSKKLHKKHHNKKPAKHSQHLHHSAAAESDEQEPLNNDVDSADETSSPLMKKASKLKKEIK